MSNALKSKYSAECSKLSTFLQSPQETFDFLESYCLNHGIKATITEHNGLFYVQRSEIIKILRDDKTNQGCITNYLQICERYAPIASALGYRYIPPSSEVLELAKMQSFKKSPHGTHVRTSQVITALASCSSDRVAREMNTFIGLNTSSGFYTYCRSDIGKGFRGYCPHMLMGNILMSALVFKKMTVKATPVLALP